MKKKINTDLWNRIGHFGKHYLMQGEINTLSDKEITVLNAALKAAGDALDKAEEIVTTAKERFKESEPCGFTPDGKKFSLD